VASTLAALCLEALRAPPGVSLALAPIAPESLRARAPKAVTTDALLDFRTLVPVPGGLYDYKVFGPGTVIDAPPSPLDEPLRPPRTQFARLALATPLVHPLALEHAPARVAALAGWTVDELARWKTGEEPVPGALALALEHSSEGRALIIRDIAVLPPDLRPLARLADDRWQTSPINELYRNVIRRNDALARSRSSAGRDAEQTALHRSLVCLYENEDHAAPMHGAHDEVLMSLRALAGGTDDLFAALAEVAAGAPLTGRRYRASAVLFALGFELVS
jgi:DNA-directed RNA polymerase beta' subunit